MGPFPTCLLTFSEASRLAIPSFLWSYSEGEGILSPHIILSPRVHT